MKVTEVGNGLGVNINVCMCCVSYSVENHMESLLSSLTTRRLVPIKSRVLRVA